MTRLAGSRTRYLSLLLMVVFGTSSIAEQYFEKLLALAESRYGAKGRATVGDWQQMLEENQDKSEAAKLVTVNDFFNQRVKFQSDSQIWGISDYWATPLETMGLAKGDCEDFSIAKYITLLKLGIPIEKLRLIYVKADMGGGRSQAHMVLAYYQTPAAEPLLLDNLSFAVLPASKRSDLTPVYSFNSEGLWVGGDQKPKIKKPETRLSRWRDVLTRMQVDGIQ